MLVTEKEAKKLWCPAARVSDAGLGNRYPMVDDLASGMAFARCIARGCMYWRWGDEKKQVLPRDDEHRRGYCGVAGLPFELT